MLCGQMLGHISCITAIGAQIPLTGITGDDPEVSSFFVKCGQIFDFAGTTFLHSTSHVAAQLTSALQQLVCVRLHRKKFVSRVRLFTVAAQPGKNRLTCAWEAPELGRPLCFSPCKPVH